MFDAGSGPGSYQKAIATGLAARFNPDIRQKYEHLIKAGKPPKVAITAVMRKRVIRANALLRNQSKWAEINPQQPGN